MRDYELKRGIAKNLEGDGLRQIGVETFGEAGTEGNRIIVSFGAIEKMVAWTDGKRLFVDTTMKPGAPDDVATETIKAVNTFLEKGPAIPRKSGARRHRRQRKREGPEGHSR